MIKRTPICCGGWTQKIHSEGDLSGNGKCLDCVAWENISSILGAESTDAFLGIHTTNIAVGVRSGYTVDASRCFDQWRPALRLLAVSPGFGSARKIPIVPFRAGHISAVAVPKVDGRFSCLPYQPAAIIDGDES